jgi:hypothetical protein
MVDSALILVCVIDGQSQCSLLDRSTSPANQYRIEQQRFAHCKDMLKSNRHTVVGMGRKVFWISMCLREMMVSRCRSKSINSVRRADSGTYGATYAANVALGSALCFLLFESLLHHSRRVAEVTTTTTTTIGSINHQ